MSRGVAPHDTPFSLAARRITVVGGYHIAVSQVAHPGCGLAAMRWAGVDGVRSPAGQEMGSMSQQRLGVLIAIDWENIRRGAQLYGRTVKPA